MVALRRPHLAHLLIVAACSSASPAGDSVVEGAFALQGLDCNSSSFCPQENVEGASLAQGAMWVTRAQTQCPQPAGNGSCAQFTLGDQLEHVAFGADGGVAQLAATPTVVGANVGTMSSGVGVTPDGASGVFAWVDPTANALHLQTLAGAASSVPVPNANGGAWIIGIAADPTAAVVAVAPPPNGGGSNNDSDTGQFSLGSNTGGAVSGTLYRVALDGGAPPQSISASFDLDGSAHPFAADASNVYWVGGGVVMQQARDLSGQAQPVGTIPPALGGKGCMNGQCPLALAVGLDVAGGVVAWSVARGTSTCGGACSFAPADCTVWKNDNLATNQSTLVYQAPSQSCMGIAVDGGNAYFAIVEQRPVTCDNCSLSYATFTTGIARISLNGPPGQKPAVVPVDPTRLYGPRRFFVDGTYVYGIDPAYVLRVSKSAFGP
jgi:hypothetical protein